MEKHEILLEQVKALNDPEAMLNLWHALANTIEHTEFPRLRVKEFDEDIDGETITTLRCPHCGNVVDEESLIVVDWGVRWTYAAEILPDEKTVGFNYDDGTDVGFLNYLCGHCQKGISLPTNWTELN